MTACVGGSGCPDYVPERERAGRSFDAAYGLAQDDKVDVLVNPEHICEYNIASFGCSKGFLDAAASCLARNDSVGATEKLRR